MKDTKAINWVEKNIPEQNNKTVIVTGANSGLGYTIAEVLANKGAIVIFACRNEKKAKEAMQKIKEEAKHDLKIDFIQLDLADIESIKQFVSEFHNRYKHVDILVNNAGVMALPYSTTKQGIEMQMGINHIGHFVLTSLLFETLKNTNNSRIVNMSSYVYREAKRLGVDFKKFNNKEYYGRFRNYSASKLANILFTLELQKRIDSSGLSITAYSSHPGFSRTNLASTSFGIGSNLGQKLLMNTFGRMFGQSQEIGALGALMAATMDVEKAGLYGPVGMTGLPERNELLNEVMNNYSQEELWEISEEVSGVKFVV